MENLWLLEGPHEAPGWGLLEGDARGKKIDVALFDRDAWALVRAAEAPAQYEGLVARAPADGLYLDQQGRGVYVAGGREAPSARDVLALLGEQARELLRRVGDPDTVLERLGRVF
jgi:hypothetical protein